MNRRSFFRFGAVSVAAAAASPIAALATKAVPRGPMTVVAVDGRASTKQLQALGDKVRDALASKTVLAHDEGIRIYQIARETTEVVVR